MQFLQTGSKCTPCDAHLSSVVLWEVPPSRPCQMHWKDRRKLPEPSLSPGMHLQCSGQGRPSWSSVLRNFLYPVCVADSTLLLSRWVMRWRFTILSRNLPAQIEDWWGKQLQGFFLSLPFFGTGIITASFQTAGTTPFIQLWLKIFRSTALKQAPRRFSISPVFLSGPGAFLIWMRIKLTSLDARLLDGVLDSSLKDGWNAVSGWSIKTVDHFKSAKK